MMIWDVAFFREWQTKRRIDLFWNFIVLWIDLLKSTHFSQPLRIFLSNVSLSLYKVNLHTERLSRIAKRIARNAWSMFSRRSVSFAHMKTPEYEQQWDCVGLDLTPALALRMNLNPSRPAACRVTPCLKELSNSVFWEDAESQIYKPLESRRNSSRLRHIRQYNRSTGSTFDSLIASWFSFLTSFLNSLHDAYIR